MGIIGTRKSLLAKVFLFLLFLPLLFGGSVYAAGSPIVIGVPTALGSIEGRDTWFIVRMAVDEINAAGGVLVGNERRQLKAFSIDTRGHEAGIPVHDALTAVEKLILEKKPHAILVGAFRSEILLASMDLIAKYKVPYICTIAMTPVFQKKVLENYDNYKYMFRMCLDARYFVMYLTKVMGFLNKEFGFSKAYIVAQDVLWARGSGKALQGLLPKQGWEITGFDTYPTGSTDYSSSLIKARMKKAQVIVPIGDMPQLAILSKQSRAMKVPALLAGEIAAVCSQISWEATEGAVEGMLNFIFEAGNIPVKAIPKSQVFHRNFGKRYGQKALENLSGHGPGPSYDAVYALAAAIERAGTLEPNAVVKALEQTDMEGAIGRAKFGKDHQVIFGFDPKETALGVVIQWRKPGIRIPVFPEVVAEGKIELPPYMKK
jgi:branched-chain amino acid transport system substrate-binding protein